MPTIHPPRLLKADVIRDMKASTLRSLLSPHSIYLASRGVDLGELGAEGFDHGMLAFVLASPTEQTPPELVEKIELVDLISTSQSTLNFEAEYHEVVQRLREPDVGAPDLAVKILLEAPDVAIREFYRQALQAQRSLVSFRVRPGRPFLGTSRPRLEEFRAIVAPWFRDHARSGVCIVGHIPEPDGEAFVIRHGDVLKRIGTLNEDGRSESHVLRPERLDMARFNRSTGEWQVSGVGVKIQDLYRTAFGTAFHGSADALAYSRRYSLEPLREGSDSLLCDPNATVQFVELKSIKLGLPGGQRMTLDNPPLFDALESHSPGLLGIADLNEATLSFKLFNRRSRPQVRICPARDTIAGTNAHPAIAEWLQRHGFTNDASRLLASA